MDGLRDYADDSTRWYSADAPSGRRSRRSRSEEHGYRVPEPRGSETASPRRAAGGERRRSHSEEDRLGDRYGTELPAVVPDPLESGRSSPNDASSTGQPADFHDPGQASSYPGFEVRTAMDAGSGTAPASPTTYSGGSPVRSPLPEVTVSGYAAVRGTPTGTPTGPPAASVGDGVYRSRRPGVAVLLAAAVLVLELPAVRMLLDGFLATPVVPATTVCGMFLVAGTPLLAFGLYALMAGVGRASDQPVAHAWFRPPTGYLTVGLVLFLAAALAA